MANEHEALDVLLVGAGNFGGLLHSLLQRLSVLQGALEPRPHPAGMNVQ